MPDLRSQTVMLTIVYDADRLDEPLVWDWHTVLDLGAQGDSLYQIAATPYHAASEDEVRAWHEERGSVESGAQDPEIRELLASANELVERLERVFGEDVA